MEADKKDQAEADHLAVANQAKTDRRELWKEFLSRHPHWHRKLFTVGQDMRQAREERETVETHVRTLIADLGKSQAEDARLAWEKANGVTQEGEEQNTDEGKPYEKLMTEYRSAMDTFKLVQRHYVEVATKFNEAHEASNELFTDYVNTTYDNVLVLPDMIEYDESVPLLGEDLTRTPSSTQEELDFVQFQNKHLNVTHNKKMQNTWREKKGFCDKSMPVRVSLYLHSPNDKIVQNPVVFWKIMGDTYPTLADIFFRRIPLVATRRFVSGFNINPV